MEADQQTKSAPVEPVAPTKSDATAPNQEDDVPRPDGSSPTPHPPPTTNSGEEPAAGSSSTAPPPPSASERNEAATTNNNMDRTATPPRSASAARRRVCFSPNVQVADLAVSMSPIPGWQREVVGASSPSAKNETEEGDEKGGHTAEGDSVPRPRGGAGDSFRGEGEDDVFHRLHDHGKQHHEARKHLDKSAAESREHLSLNPAGLAECTFKPSITALAKERGTRKDFELFLHDQKEWVRRRENKVAAAQARVEDAEQPPLFDDMPRKESKKILDYMERRALYKGPISGWEEHFQHFAAKRSHSQNEAQQPRRSDSHTPRRAGQQHADPTGSSLVVPRSLDVSGDPPSSNGNISRRSAALYERLYEDAAAREAALHVIAQTQIEKEAREMFKPTTNESWLRDGDSSFFPREELLLKKGELYQQRKEERAAQYMLGGEVYSFKPATNPNSRRLIIQRAAQREEERMIAASAAEYSSSADDHNTTSNSTSTHGRVVVPPKLNFSSGDATAGRQAAAAGEGKIGEGKVFDVDVFCARVLRHQVEKVQRVADLRRHLKLEEIAECSFRPAISKKSHESAQRRRGPPSTTASPAGLQQSPYSSKASPAPRHHRNVSEPLSFSPEERSSQSRNRTTTSAGASAAGGAVPHGVLYHPSASTLSPSSYKARTMQAATSRTSSSTAEQQPSLEYLEEELKEVLAEWSRSATSMN